jgi:hypothetical protein
VGRVEKREGVTGFEICPEPLIFIHRSQSQPCDNTGNVAAGFCLRLPSAPRQNVVSAAGKDQALFVYMELFSPPSLVLNPEKDKEIFPFLLPRIISGLPFLILSVNPSSPA